jgi:hypothetical protein
MYICNLCNKEYKSYNGFVLHNKNIHIKVDDKQIKKYKCQYCVKEYKHKQSKYNHEKSCKEKNKPIENKIKNIIDKTSENNIQNNNIQNNSNNNSNNNIKIKYVINNINSQGISQLTLEEQRNIMNKGLNCLTYLIEKVNFNESNPENHAFCVTAINDKHASMINPDNNKVIKTDKTSLFDKVLTASLKNLELLCQNDNFSAHEIEKFEKKFLKLKELLFTGKSGLKIFYTELNLLSYNKKDLILETWASLKTLDKIIESETKKEKKIMTMEDLANAGSSYELSDNSEQNAYMDKKRKNLRKNYIRSKYEMKLNNYDTDIE